MKHNNNTQTNTTSSEQSEDTHNPQQGDQQGHSNEHHTSKHASAESSPSSQPSPHEQVLRLQAEFANYKRRSLEDLERATRNGKADVLRTFVELFDNFELALKHYNKESADEFHKGMEMLFAKMISSAESIGLQRIDTTSSFNATEHEALLAEESEKPEGTILEELQTGYKLDEMVLRTAKVKVSRK